MNYIRESSNKIFNKNNIKSYPERTYSNTSIKKNSSAQNNPTYDQITQRPKSGSKKENIGYNFPNQNSQTSSTFNTNSNVKNKYEINENLKEPILNFDYNTNSNNKGFNKSRPNSVNRFSSNTDIIPKYVNPHKELVDNISDKINRLTSKPKETEILSYNYKDTKIDNQRQSKEKDQVLKKKYLSTYREKEEDTGSSYYKAPLSLGNYLNKDSKTPTPSSKQNSQNKFTFDKTNQSNLMFNSNSNSQTNTVERKYDTNNKDISSYLHDYEQKKSEETINKDLSGLAGTKYEQLLSSYKAKLNLKIPSAQPKEINEEFKPKISIESLSKSNLELKQKILGLERDLNFLKEENKEIGKYYPLKVSTDQIVLHKAYKINDLNHFALISDQQNKVYSWVNLAFSENSKLFKHIKDVPNLKNLESEFIKLREKTKDFIDNNSNEEIESLKIIISDYQKIEKKLKAQLEDVETSLNSLNETISLQKEQYDHNLQGLIKGRDSLTIELNAFKNENYNLKEKIDLLLKNENQRNIEEIEDLLIKKDEFYTSKISNLEQIIAGNELNIQELNKSLFYQNEEKNIILVDLKNKETDFLKLKNENDNLRIEMTNLIIKNEQLIEQTNTIKEEQNSYFDNIEVLEKDLKNAKVLLESNNYKEILQQEKIDKLIEENTQLNQDYNEIDKKYEKVLLKNSELMIDINELKNEILQFQPITHKVEVLIKEKAQLEKQLHDKEAMLKLSNESLSQFQSQISNLNDKNNELQNIVENDKLKINEYQTIINLKSTELLNYNSAKSDIEELLLLKEDEIIKYKEELENSYKKLAEESSNFKEAKTKLTQIEEDYRITKENNNILISSIDDHLISISSLEQDKNQLTILLNDVKDDFKRVSKILDEVELKKIELIKDKKLLESTIIEITTKCDNLTLENMSYSDKYERSKDEVIKLTEEIKLKSSSLEKIRDDQTNCIENEREQKKDLLNEINNLNTSLNQNQEEIILLKNSIKELKQENEIIKNDKINTESANKTLFEKNAILQELVNSKQNELETLILNNNISKEKIISENLEKLNEIQTNDYIKIKELTNLNDKLNNEINHFNTILQENQMAKIQLEIQNEQLNTENKENNRILNNEIFENNNLKINISKLEDKVLEIESALDIKNKELSYKDEQILIQEKEITNLNFENNKKQEKIESLENILGQKDFSNQDYLKLIDKETSEKETALKSLHNLENKLTELTDELKRNEESLNLEKEKFEANQIDKEFKLQQLSKSYEEEILTLNEKLSKAQIELNENKEIVKTLESDKITLNKEIHSFNESIKNLENKILNLNYENENLSKEKLKFEDKILADNLLNNKLEREKEEISDKFIKFEESHISIVKDFNETIENMKIKLDTEEKESKQKDLTIIEYKDQINKLEIILNQEKLNSNNEEESKLNLLKNIESSENKITELKEIILKKNTEFIEKEKEYMEEIGNLKIQINGLKNLSEDNYKLNEELKEKNLFITNLQIHLEEAILEKEKFETKLKNQEELNIILLNKQETANNELLSNKESLDNLQEEFCQLDQKYSNLEKTYKEKEELNITYLNTIKALEYTIEEHKERIGSLSTTNQILREEISEFKNNKNLSKNQDLFIDQESIIILKQLDNKIKQKNDKLEEELEVAKAEAEAFKNMVDQLNNDLNMVNNQRNKDLLNKRNTEVSNISGGTMKTQNVDLQLKNLKNSLAEKEELIRILSIENNNFKQEMLEEKQQQKYEVIEEKEEIVIEANKIKEKIENYKQRLSNAKSDNDSLHSQMKLLKAEIKNLKNKNSDLLCFSGRITEYVEFCNLLNIVLDGKKKGKEYEEACKKIKDHIAVDVLDEDDKHQKEIMKELIKDKEKEKKGFLGGLFGKK